MHTIATFTNHTFRGTGQFIAHGSVELGYYNNNQIALVIYDHHKGPYATATINLADLNINPPLGHIVIPNRSEEHTSELQSRFDLVCRLLLEQKKDTLHLPQSQY